MWDVKLTTEMSQTHKEQITVTAKHSKSKNTAISLSPFLHLPSESGVFHLSLTSPLVNKEPSETQPLLQFYKWLMMIFLKNWNRNKTSKQTSTWYERRGVENRRVFPAWFLLSQFFLLIVLWASELLTVHLGVLICGGTQRGCFRTECWNSTNTPSTPRDKGLCARNSAPSVTSFVVPNWYISCSSINGTMLSFLLKY